MRRLIAGLSLFLLASPATAAERPSDPQAALQPHRGKQATVVVFLSTGCPISNAYLPHLNDMAKKYDAQGVKFVGVNANAQDLAEDVVKHAKEFAIGFPVLKDEKQLIADALGAERVPEVFVLDAKQKVRYQGRIDDRYQIGGRKDTTARADLAVALDEVLAGKEVSQPRTTVSGCPIGRDTAKPQDAITYSNQVARIIQNRCQACHRADGVAPFALSSYDQVKGWAKALKEVVVERRMPPWHADPKHGKFANDRSLPQAEIDTLIAWVDGGRIKGDEKDLPKPVEFAKSGWTIGEPDVVLKMAKEFTVPATGVLGYQDFVVETNFKEDRWVERAQIRPGNKKVVHHVGVFLDGANHGEWLFLYVPGDSPLVLTPGTAMKIPAGAKLRFNVHYTPNGKVEQDRTEVGLIFAKQPPQHEVRHRLFQKNDIKIPAGAANHREEGEFTIGHDMHVISYFPHMHLRGKSWECRAHYPDGRTETILKVPGYDFNWQHTYRFAEPLFLPGGTKLQCIAHYDNSDKNPANPDPRKTVTFGPQSWDEMLVCSLEFVVPMGQRNTPTTIAAKAERIVGPPVEQFARKAADHAAKLSGNKTNSEPDAGRAVAVKLGAHAALLVPDKRLTEAALDKAGKDVTPIGMIWLRGFTPTIAGQKPPREKLQIVNVPGSREQSDIQLCVLGVRRNGDGRIELVVLAKDQELVSVPLQKADSKQSLPLEMEVAEIKDTTAVLAFNLLGKYKADVPVVRGEP